MQKDAGPLWATPRASGMRARARERAIHMNFHGYIHTHTHTRTHTHTQSHIYNVDHIHASDYSKGGGNNGTGNPYA